MPQGTDEGMKSVYLETMNVVAPNTTGLVGLR